MILLFRSAADGGVHMGGRRARRKENEGKKGEGAGGGREGGIFGRKLGVPIGFLPFFYNRRVWVRVISSQMCSCTV